MRYDLSDFKWSVIEPVLPKGRLGPRRKDDRRVLNGIFWVLRTGAPWRDLPERYGPYTTAYNRFNRWLKAGVWHRLMDVVIKAHGDKVQMIDSPIVRVHRHASGVKKGWRSLCGAKPRRAHHENPARVDRQGRPLQLLITPGQANDLTGATLNSGCPAVSKALVPDIELTDRDRAIIMTSLFVETVFGIHGDSMTSAKKLSRCRVCGSTHLVPVLNLGEQALTGIFPSDKNSKITAGPLELVWNPDCGLVQLNHSYDADEMYGDNYGYRSGLNQSMVDHLKSKALGLQQRFGIRSGDTVLDIGSNDSTFLQAFDISGLSKIGIDPTGSKYKSFYTNDICLVPDFFSAKNFRSVTSASAKLITSIAMFYDLEDPIEFARQISSILTPDGIWHFEQSYMPAMLRTTSYDTVCHEHLEYYSLKTVKFIVESAGMRVVDVVMNSINGGSFAVSACQRDASIKSNNAIIEWLLEQEEGLGLFTPRPYREFEERVFTHRNDLTRLIRKLRADGKKIFGYGASTKGNVLLQFCGLGPGDLEAIAEVNSGKFGHYTPGTDIPIISEVEAHANRPDYFLVLPWHFKESIIKREGKFLANGGHLIFPLPEIEIR
jgi:transposase